ncbi:MAG: hypothetical protein ACLQFF_12560 [Steroidobacteraceae bacterium]|jgi:hypothetical protein
MSKVTPLKPKPEDSDELPINVINDNLRKAYAIVDLIYTMVDCAGDNDAPLESLTVGTLEESLHCVMQRLREAQEAAGKLAGAHSAGPAQGRRPRPPAAARFGTRQPPIRRKSDLADLWRG